MCVRTSFSIMLSAALLFGIAGSANAGVIYNWAQIANSSDIHSTSGSLEVTDDAYRSGSLSVDYNTAVFGPVPDSPLLNFTFTVNGANYPLELMPRSPGSEGVIHASLQFTNRLAGSITADDLQAQIEFRGDTQSWYINRFGSDGGNTGCSLMSCSGATGFWRVDRSTVPDTAVPEPPTGLLFAASLVGFGLIRRRMRKSGKYKGI